MAKWWSIFFAVTMVACLALFIVSPMVGWWLPEGVSTHSGDVDSLFYLILYITGFFFILTEALLVIFMWKFGSRSSSTEGQEKKPAPGWVSKIMQPIKKVIPDEHRLELAWTIVPAAILLYIAFVQVEAWARIKYQSRMPAMDGQTMQIAVSARQFEWRMRYPSPERWESWKKDPKLARDFAMNPHQDDIHVVNELHVWTNENAESTEEFPAMLVHLSTIDVQHNFNIPSFRVKQDALPGKTIPVWFRPTLVNYEFNESKKGWVYNEDRVWEIACAELCGRSHYNMKGKVFVHPNEESFLKWLKEEADKQFSASR